MHSGLQGAILLQQAYAMLCCPVAPLLSIIADAPELERAVLLQGDSQQSDISAVTLLLSLSCQMLLMPLGMPTVIPIVTLVVLLSLRLALCSCCSVIFCLLR